MPLYYLLALLLSLCFGSLPGATAPTPGGPVAVAESSESLTQAIAEAHFVRAVAFTGTLLWAWSLFCALLTRLVTRLVADKEVTPVVAWRWMERQWAALRWVSLALVVLCLGGFGLARDLDRLPGLQQSLALQTLVLVTPALAMMAAVWVSEHRFAAGMGAAEPGLRPAVRSTVAALCGTVGWMLAPILVLMAAADLIAWLASPQTARWVLAVSMPMAVVGGAPLLVRALVPTGPPRPERRAWMATILAAAGLPPCRIAVWQTGGTTFNAMLAGCTTRFRTLLVSDRLIAELPDDELAMVLLHEAAHARRRHVPVRFALLVPAWLAGGAAERLLRSQHVSLVGAEWSALVGSLLAVALTIGILRLVSHWQEHDADAMACQLAPAVAAQVPGVPGDSNRAADALARALLRVSGDCPAAWRSSWMHPSLPRRLRQLSERSSQRNALGRPDPASSSPPPAAPVG